MEQIEGYVEHILYRKPETGYTVFRIESSEIEGTVVGIFSTIEEGEYVVVIGDYEEHPVYELQFRAKSYEIKEPTDTEGIIRYLSSGAIKGVGVALAKRIVAKFGEETITIMETQPERLAEIKGISERKACEIGMQAEAKKEVRGILMFLQQYGISNKLANKIYDTFGVGIYKIMQENPYRIAEEIEGVGFKTADEIARKAGISVDSDYRIRSGILYVLSAAMAEGHTYLPKSQLEYKTLQLLELTEAMLGTVSVQIQNLTMDKKVYVQRVEDSEEFAVFGASAYQCEVGCTRRLKGLKEQKLASANKEKIQSEIDKIEDTEGVVLDDLQRQAVVESMLCGVTILTGGPGTGKTTTINTMIRLFDAFGMNILLAAPTGRAAKRMTEATGYEAKTIHRLLEVNGAGEDAHFFERNENNPLEADVVIIDEMSMVDIFLFYNLLKAIPEGTRLVLVGDKDQLPSVGPGNVLNDLIESDCFSIIRLGKIFRQAKESDIVQNAHRILESSSIVLDNKSKDFFFVEREDARNIYQNIVQLCQTRIPKHLNISPYEIQILTPTRKGMLGVEVLNEVLQEHLNPKDQNKREYKTDTMIFREGDKVMQIRNNYKLEWEIVSKYNIPIDKGCGVFNGDIGIVKQINTYAETVTVEFDEHRLVTYQASDLDELELAYAITVHKSQGSEYPAVVMPILGVPRMLKYRNLFYTAVTRAKDMVTLLGSQQEIMEMTQNGTQQKRYSGLKEQLRRAI